MEGDKPFTWRRYSAAGKARVLAECDAPGASVAKVAMAHGINANVVHRWRQLARETPTSEPVRLSGFVQLALPALNPAVVAGELRIHL
ncbi:transposase [Caldimonas tepidiphila]|uniref:transposase n=1 Tax=Caldimonas tepidiphila TaxID=2315841 RepID=UPI000E5B359F|nr:transposase [Caldimonas tepidiphila]